RTLRGGISVGAPLAFGRFRHGEKVHGRRYTDASRLDQSTYCCFPGREEGRWQCGDVEVREQSTLLVQTRRPREKRFCESDRANRHRGGSARQERIALRLS